MVNRYSEQCVLYPCELAMLQRVFDEIRADGSHDAAVDAEMLAAELLGLFQNGLTSEAALLGEMQSRQHVHLLRTG